MPILLTTFKTLNMFTIIFTIAILAASIVFYALTKKEQNTPLFADYIDLSLQIIESRLHDRNELWMKIENFRQYYINIYPQKEVDMLYDSLTTSLMHKKY